MNAFLKNPVVGRISKFLFLSLFCCCFVGSVNGQFEFLGTEDQNWSNAGNWAGGTAPTNGTSGLTIIISADVDIDVATWLLGSGSTMTINSGITATFSASGNTTFFNFGTINNNGIIDIPGNDPFQNNGAINNNSVGIINILETFTNTNLGVFNNFGIINIGDQNSDTFTNNGSLVNNGTINLNNGNLIQTESDVASISGAGSFNLEDGNSNNGTGDGTLTLESGSFSPGNSFGTMSITGNLILTGMTLNMEVGGDGPTFRDLISVTGNLTISVGPPASNNNTLNLIYGPGLFTPGENWVIIDVTGTLSGTFATVNFTPPAAFPAATLTATYPGTTVVVTHSGATFLPIELASFSGEAVDNTIELNWTTTNELNNDYMIVERSGDGLDFSDVGRVDGKGTTSEAQSYIFVDLAPLNGLNYYRLRQVDLDGTEHYSNVIVIDMEMEINGIQLKAYPNPSQDLVQVVWQSSATADDGTIHLIEGTTGRILQRFAMPEGTNRLDIPVQNLPSGMYVIQVVQADQRKAIQFMKN